MNDFADAVGSEAAQNDFLRARVGTLDEGLFKREGGDAIAEAPAAESRLATLRDVLVEQARSPDQRAMLGPDLDVHLELARDAIARHVDRQAEAWDHSVRAERIGLLQDRARRDWRNPEKLALYADAAASASDQPEATRSGLWRAAIDAALAAGQHGAALDLHKDAADHLTPQDADALVAELAIAAQMQKGRDYVADLLPQPMPATAAETQAAHDAASARNTADWSHDPEQQATNQHLIDVQFGRHQRGLSEADAARDRAVQDWLARRDAQGNVQTERPPPSLWKQLDAGQRQAVDATLAQNARGASSGVLAPAAGSAAGEAIRGLAPRILPRLAGLASTAVGAAGAGLPVLLTPGNAGDGRYYDLAAGLRAYHAPGSRNLVIERRSAPDGPWETVPIDAQVGGIGTPERPGFAINRGQLLAAVGADRAAEVARLPGVSLIEGESGEDDKKSAEPSPGLGHNSGEKLPAKEEGPPPPPENPPPPGNVDASSSRSRLPDQESQLGHILRVRPGHIPDSPENRRLLEDLANDETAFRGTDGHGNAWFERTRSDGTQVWVKVRDGVIQNGGVNAKPKSFHPKTGLSSPTR